MRARSKAGLTGGGRLILLLAAFVLFAAKAEGREKPTECLIQGETYHNIFDVHLTADGRVAILYRVGGMTVDRDDLPKDFLDSWGIKGTATPKATGGEASQGNLDYLRYMQQQELDEVVRSGMIRRVDDKIYDLRKPQEGWETISGGKVNFTSGEVTVLEMPGTPLDKRFIIVKNLPVVGTADQSVTALAKFVGRQKFSTKAGDFFMPVYDYGHVCAREEVPLSILSMGVIDRASDLWANGLTNIAPPQGIEEAHSMGSGFFVSPDGYLLTSFHVVAHAAKVKLNYGGEVLPAEIKQVDKTNDLALLKAEGRDFKWVPVSREASAVLGQFVFTIGFPNPSLQGWEPKYSDGNISSLDGLRDDPREYQTSVAIQPGNSGGALCDAAGTVVGIVRAELNTRAALMSDGALPQSVNYAVKSRFALPLLDAANIASDASPAMADTNGGTQTARDRVRAATAMVIAE